jgi:hypothetical protein
VPAKHTGSTLGARDGGDVAVEELVPSADAPEIVSP